jgi:hypothetical protein
VSRADQTPAGWTIDDEGYAWDVFLSYPSAVEKTRVFTRKVLAPLLARELEAQLGRRRLALDAEAIEAGELWPDRLQQMHLRARVFVSVLCWPYFTRSGWCCAEWHSAVEREAQTPERTHPLLFPLRLIDLDEDSIERLGQPWRDQVASRKPLDLHEWANVVNPLADNDRSHALRDTISDFVERRLVPAIERAPAWRPDFPLLPAGPARPAPAPFDPRF